MVWRILLIILALVILLIFFVPYGVDAGYEEGVLSLRIKAGPFRFTLYPKKPPTEKQRAKQRRKKEKTGAKKKTGSEKQKKPAEEKPAGVDETITVREKIRWDIETVTALLRMALHALRRFCRSFSIDFLKIHYTVAGADPCNTALRYGRLCAAAAALPELCGGAVRVRRRDIALGCDFTESWPDISIRIVMSLQLFRIVHMAAAFLAEYLVWKLKTRREKKAAALSERKDDNGRQPDQ